MLNMNVISALLINPRSLKQMATGWSGGLLARPNIPFESLLNIIHLHTSDAKRYPVEALSERRNTSAGYCFKEEREHS